MKDFSSLYRKCRPKTFEEIIGQKNSIDALRAQVRTGSIAHAYLFSGTRGTGKTSTALVFARAINCKNPVDGSPCMKCESCLGASDIDIIEMDAASFNSVDDIRELRENVKYAPAYGKRKVYIIDEVHMLSTGAFNALLKTLEEPPEYVVFILATTELHKVPATVQSRCQRFEFKRIQRSGMQEKIAQICTQYGITLEPNAADLLIRASDGAMRDILALLEQCLSLGITELTEQNISEVLGIARSADLLGLLRDTIWGKPIAVMDRLALLKSSGVEMLQLLSSLIDVCRDLVLLRISPKHVVEGSEEYTERARKVAESLDFSRLTQVYERLVDISKDFRYSRNRSAILEVTLVKMGVDFNDGSVAIPAPNYASGLVLENAEPCANAATPKPAPQTIPEPVSETTAQIIAELEKEEAKTNKEESKPKNRSEKKQEMSPVEPLAEHPAESFVEHPVAADEEDPFLLIPDELLADESIAIPEESGPSLSSDDFVVPDGLIEKAIDSVTVKDKGGRTSGEEPTTWSKPPVSSAKASSADSGEALPERKKPDYRYDGAYDELWGRALSRIPESKQQLLKKSRIGHVEGTEVIIELVGLSERRQSLLEAKVRADVVDALKAEMNGDYTVRFVSVPKGKEEIEETAEKVRDFFDNKEIPIEIK